MFIEFPVLNDLVVQGLEDTRLPRMVKIRQIFDRRKIENIQERLNAQIVQAVKDKESVKGKRVCIAVGSRGIPHLQEIVKTVCDVLKGWGANPFIVPAMGSHGGATVEGQIEILKGYGITEEAMEVPILATMEVRQYGTLDNDTPLYVDKNAYEADWIVIINKEKPHTSFRGPHESGLAKMIAIGLAKHVGAAAFHRQGMGQFARRVPEAARCFLKTMPVLFGVGIVENAYDEICEINAAGAENFMKLDEKNLKLAKRQMAKFKFPAADVLVIDEIGKNISGHGHDPNITGRSAVEDDSFKHVLDLSRMVILGLSEESHHNGNGIADADISTRRCLNDIDWSVVWTNVLTSNVIHCCKIPLYGNNDREAILIAVRTCISANLEQLKMVRIHNTLEMDCIEVSEALYEEIKDRPDVELLKGPYDWKFDKEGNLI